LLPWIPSLKKQNRALMMSSGLILFTVAAALLCGLATAAVEPVEPSCGFKFSREFLNDLIYKNLRTKIDSGYKFDVLQFKPMNTFVRDVPISQTSIETGGLNINAADYSVEGLSSFVDNRCKASLTQGATKVICKISFPELVFTFNAAKFQGEFNNIQLSKAGTLPVTLTNVETEFQMGLQSCDNAILLLGKAGDNNKIGSLSFDPSEMQPVNKYNVAFDAALPEVMPNLLQEELKLVAGEFFNVLIKEFQVVLQASYAKCNAVVNPKEKKNMPNCKPMKTDL